jgi:hypothetical protein
MRPRVERPAKSLVKAAHAAAEADLNVARLAPCPLAGLFGIGCYPLAGTAFRACTGAAVVVLGK